MKKSATQSSQLRVIGALIAVTALVLLVLKIASDSDTGRDPIAARTTAVVDPFLRSRVRIVCKNRSGQSQTFALSLLRGSAPEDVIKTIHSTCSIPLHHSISLRDGAGVYYVIDSYLPEFLDLLVESEELEGPKNYAAPVAASVPAVSGPKQKPRPQTNTEIAFGTEQTEDAAAKVMKATVIDEILRVRKLSVTWDYRDSKAEFFMVDMADGRGSEDIITYVINFEPEVRKLFARLLQVNPCQEVTYSDGWLGVGCETRFGNYEPVVMDVGANAGFYGLLSASFGHDVISIEPQPHCNQWIGMSVLANGYGHRYKLINALASDNPSLKATIPARTGCWGTWPRTTKAQEQVSEQIFGANLPDVVVPSIGLDELLLNTNKIVHFMKIDVEGHEGEVILSAKKLIKQRRVLNIFVELGFVMWAEAGVARKDVLDVMLDLMDDYDYKCMCFGGFEHTQWATREMMIQLLDPKVDIITTECWFHLRDAK
eukprot:TRINITY_DN1262_c0_g1_i1.p1 TRINITY_DN1262_c0_g1~~TRINITY_DN1262_c0_g1_i1.p1  ORF type:complete len:485 (+),score=218.00 TRINITY_DN1262_c0_g1_i1:75-1529(+)